MMDPARTSPKKSGSARSFLRRKPVAIAAAVAVGAALLGAYAVPERNAAIAQTATAPQTVETPYGHAPISFSSLVKKIRPAVVSVRVKNGVDKNAERGFNFRDLPGLPEGNPFEEFLKPFGRGGEREGRQRHPRPTMAQGSGFIISSDGYVVTNNHVIDDASEIVLTLDSGDEVKADIVGKDERTDLALLKIKSGKSYPYVEFADKQAEVGDWVLAVGNPFGLGGTVTAGIISAHNRDIGSGPYDYLQIDAAVNRGNSGGPAFNLEGKVVGVNTAIFSPSGGNVGIAFAVPAVLAKKVVAELQDNGTVARGWLGVTIQDVSEDFALSRNLKDDKGAIITTLSPNGPATKSDLKVGDIIVRVNDTQIDGSRDLARTIADYTPDTKVRITVLRDGKKKVVPVELGTFPTGPQLVALRSGSDEPVPQDMNDLGLSLAPATARRGAGDEGVVIVDVDPDGLAAEKGLKAGDVILSVSDTTVSSPEDVSDAIEQARKNGRGAVDMLVRSGKRQRYIALRLNKT